MQRGRIRPTPRGPSANAPSAGRAFAIPSVRTARLYGRAHGPAFESCVRSTRIGAWKFSVRPAARSYPSRRFGCGRHPGSFAIAPVRGWDIGEWLPASETGDSFTVSTWGSTPENSIGISRPRFASETAVVACVGSPARTIGRKWGMRCRFITSTTTRPTTT